MDLATVATGTGELCHERGLVRGAGVAVEVLDGRGQEGDPLLQLGGQRVLDELPEAEDHPDDRHPLQHAVDVLQPLEQLLHDVRLVEVSPECDEDLLVEQDELPELGDLALDVPHQGLVQ